MCISFVINTSMSLSATPQTVSRHYMSIKRDFQNLTLVTQISVEGKSLKMKFQTLSTVYMLLFPFSCIRKVLTAQIWWLIYIFCSVRCCNYGARQCDVSPSLMTLRHGSGRCVSVVASQTCIWSHTLKTGNFGTSNALLSSLPYLVASYFCAPNYNRLVSVICECPLFIKSFQNGIRGPPDYCSLQATCNSHIVVTPGLRYTCTITIMRVTTRFPRNTGFSDYDAANMLVKRVNE